MIVTHTAAEQFAQIARRQPDVAAQFCVNEPSITFLKQRMRQIRLNGHALSTDNGEAAYDKRGTCKLSPAEAP